MGKKRRQRPIFVGLSLCDFCAYSADNDSLLKTHVDKFHPQHSLGIQSQTKSECEDYEGESAFEEFIKCAVKARKKASEDPKAFKPYVDATSIVPLQGIN